MDPAVTLLLETLDEEIVRTSRSLRGVRVQLRKLRNDLIYFKGILEKWTENPIEDEEQKVLVKQLRAAVCDADDILADFIFEETKNRRTFMFMIPYPSDHARKLFYVAKKIESMKDKVEEIHERKIKQDEQGSKIGPTHLRPKLVLPTAEEQHVVGFDDEAKTVIELLMEGSDDLEVISIIGMSGLGKTTLAKMIFHDARIKYEFYHRVWVYVSKDCKENELFLQILSHFTKVTNELREMSSQDLSNEVDRYLEREKYLIVLDDVWEPNDWIALGEGFPKKKNKSRILITSRNESVAKHANPNRPPHKLRPLTDEESFKLLKMKALGSEDCPQDLAIHTEHIAKECRGLPLSIVMIGGILQEKGIESSWWRDVSTNLKSYINMDPEENMKMLIASAFYQLPYPSKACFLYFGMFPKDTIISARRLLRMWIAEGFVQKIGDRSLEQIAEEYLEDLVKRNLVIVAEWRSNGKIKTCHVRDMIRSFCMEMAVEENLYHEVKEFDPSTYKSSNPEFQKYRRICIHSRVLEYLTSRASISPQIRSFSCSSSKEIPLQYYSLVSCIPRNFKLLRVLDSKPIVFSLFPRDLSQLSHLRYLVLSIRFRILPYTISNLWNLQTLIVHTTSRTLEIRGESFKLLRLRHLETNASTSWPALSKERSEIEEIWESTTNANLTTLSTISPETCTKDAFDRVPNIEKLGIRGQLATILNGTDRSCSFDNLMTLKFLQNLKLINHVLDVSDVAGEIVCLPNGFPPNIKKLTLTNTRLDWSHMSTLGKLGNLEILKLNENAFKGKWWDSKPGEFCALKILHIGRADLVSWQASGDHFPSLRRLSLHYCTYLKDIPLGLADISSLEAVELYWTTTSAVTSAKKIQERKNKGKGFKLLAYPPDHYL